MNPMIFRWSVWGESPDLNAMLSHSIGTFQRFFGDRHHYIVFTDNLNKVEQSLKVRADVRDFRKPDGCRFDDANCTWRKWRPACRLDSTAIEFYLDADMFLLEEPVEVWEFCSSPGAKFMCTTEPFSVGYYGNFAGRIDPSLPLINAGFIGQHIGADLTADLTAQYEWWHNAIAPDDVDYHDEQGAVRAALEPYLKLGQVALLSSERYRVVCPLNEPPVASISGLVLLHATYPHHPAFWQFHREIAAVSGVR